MLAQRLRHWANISRTLGKVSGLLESHFPKTKVNASHDPTRAAGSLNINVKVIQGCWCDKVTAKRQVFNYLWFLFRGRVSHAEWRGGGGGGVIKQALSRMEFTQGKGFKLSIANTHV